MLNEVFIAVGTMSVSPGSRWRNRLREKELRVGWRGVGRGGGGGSCEADPVLVLIWESGDPRGKHAAVSCHLCRHVIEHKVPPPPGTRGCYRGPGLRKGTTCGHFYRADTADSPPHGAAQQLTHLREQERKSFSAFFFLLKLFISQN